MNLTIAIFALAVLVFLHEAGHFLVARAVGMSPRKFYVGFPPALVKTRRNGIEYGLGAIPLGGYVKIPGMHRPAPSDLETHLGRAVEEQPILARRVECVRRHVAEGNMETARAELPPLEESVREAELSRPARRAAERGLNELRDGLGDDAYWRQATWKKVAVIFAGPAVNLVFAVVLFTTILMLDTWRVGVAVTNAPTPTIERVIADSPAGRAGLEAGDRIVAVDGDRVTTEGLLDRIAESEGTSLELTLRRDGEERTTVLAAERYEGLALPAALGRAFEITARVSREIALFFPRLVQGEGADEVSSPVGIAQVSSEALEQGFKEFLFVVGLISLSLALLNLLPLLPLDGGHIAFSLIEAVRRRPLGRELYERVSIVGIAFVLVLFTIGLSNDIGG